jgi:heptosyltransferase I
MSYKERGNRLLKALDFWVGIPLLILLSLFKVKKNNLQPLSKVRNIALFKSAAIGDTVVLSAVVGDIRRINPDARLTIFAGSSNYEAARLIPGIDEVVRLPVTQPLVAIRMLRKTDEFDLWIDFGSWPRLDALLSWAACADLKVGFASAGQYRHYLYDLAIEHRDTVHELYNYRNLLEPLGVEGVCMPSLKTSAVVREQKLVVIHMFPGGNRSYLKEWPVERWIELASQLSGKGFRIVLTGAPADRQRAQIVADQLNSQDVTSVAGTLNLEQTVNLLNSAGLVISVNTGIMHVASALGCNLVSLNGPTSVVRWGALNPNSISLKSCLDCSPCIHLGFEYKCDDNDCMREITTAAVLEATDTLVHRADSSA